VLTGAFINIYGYMTKNELKQLIVECINEVMFNEAAISSQDIADKAFELIKKTIFGLSNKIKKFNEKVPLVDQQVQIIVNDINKEIVEKLVNTKVIPCPIEFVKREHGNLGSYSTSTKKIELNWEHYLDKSVQGGYELLDPKDINFDDIHETIEHELIHQQQDEKSKGKAFDKNKTYFNDVDRGWNYLVKKYDSNKNGQLDGDELRKVTGDDFDLWQKIKQKDLVSKYGDVVLKKQELAPNASDEEFIKYVKYYNHPEELNTFAKDTVNKYVKLALNDMMNQIKSGELPNIQYSSELVKRFMLSPFVDKSNTNVFKEQQQASVQNPNLRDKLLQNRQKANQITVNQGYRDYLKRKLISLHPGYNFLNSKNKQKWWSYVYQLLLSMKFNPINVDG